MDGSREAPQVRPLPASTRVAALSLRHALTIATEALTIQEGLYRAYKAQLCTLSSMYEVPPTLQKTVHSLIVDIRRKFGFDEVTGVKIRGSTLACGEAVLLLSRLAAVAASAAKLAERSASAAID